MTTDNEYCTVSIRKKKKRWLSRLVDNTWPELCKIFTILVMFCILKVTVVVSVSCITTESCQGGLKSDSPSSFFLSLQWGSYVFQGGSNPHNLPANFFPGFLTKFAAKSCTGFPSHLNSIYTTLWNLKCSSRTFLLDRETPEFIQPQLSSKFFRFESSW